MEDRLFKTFFRVDTAMSSHVIDNVDCLILAAPLCEIAVEKCFNVLEGEAARISLLDDVYTTIADLNDGIFHARL